MSSIPPYTGKSMPRASKHMVGSFDLTDDLPPSPSPSRTNRSSPHKNDGCLPPSPADLKKLHIQSNSRVRSHDLLLTPPLTPASSIRNSSIGTTTSTDADSTFGTFLEAGGANTPARFLVVRFPFIYQRKAPRFWLTFRSHGPIHFTCSPYSLSLLTAWSID
jgi:hypothetical protein